MKPSEIVIGEQYRNSKYPKTVYLGTTGHDGELALQIVRSENEEMKGRIVRWIENDSTVTEFWNLFVHADPVDLSVPEVVPQEPSQNETENEPETKHKGRPRVERAPLVFPVGEFSVKELAEQNKVDYPIAFLALKEQESTGAVKFVREERRAVKGKPTRLFQKI